jgi:membrane associated rhomboid family serine protease
MNFEPLPDRYYLRDSALWNTLKHGRMVWFWLMAVLAVDLVLVGARSENSAENSFIALGLDRGGIAGWELWRLASYAPLHGGWLHRGLNLAMFVLLGSKVEWVNGPRVLSLVVVAGIVAGGLAHVLLSTSLLIGLSGACVALLLLWTTLSPESRFVPFSVSGKNLGLGIMIASGLLACMEPGAGVPGINRIGTWLEANGWNGTFAVGHACHFGGALAGWLIGRWFLRQRICLATLRAQRARREGRHN